MKVFRYIIPALSAALLMTACDNREQMPELRSDTVRECVFSASSEQTTKTYVDGLSVLWEAGDEIAVFDDAGSEKAVLALESGAGTKSATFKGTVSSAATKFFAAYPAASVSAASDSVLTIAVPAEQKLVVGGRNLDPAALVGVAATEGNELSFKNVIAAIRFTVDMNNIVSVSLKGNAGEKVAGTVKVDATNGEIVEVADSLTEVTLTPAGESFEPGQYVFTLLPVQFSQGLTLTFTDKEGNATERVNNTDLTIARSRLLDLGAFIKLYDSELSFNPGESKDIRVLSQGVGGLAVENVPDGWKVDAASLADGLLKITAPAAGAAVPAGAFDLKGTSAAGNAVVSDDVVIRLYGINSKAEFLEFRSLYQGDDETDNSRLNSPVVDPAVIGKYLVDGAVSLNADVAFDTDDMLLKAYIFKYWNLPLEGNGHSITIDFEGNVSLCALFQYLGADVRNLTIAGSASVDYTGEARLASLAATASNTEFELKNVSSSVALSSVNKVSDLGGLIAYVNQGAVTIDGCSFTGLVDYAPEAVAAAPAIGGLVGRVNTSLTVKNSSVDAPFDIALDNRKLCGAAKSGVGGIIGVTNAEKTVSLNNVTNKAVIKVTGVNAGEDRTHFAQIVGNNLAGADLSACTEEGSVTFEDYVGPAVVFAKSELASFKYGDSARYDFTVENLNGATLVSASVSEAPKGWTVDLAHATETEPYVTVTAPSQDDIKAGTAEGAGEIVIVVKTTRNEEGTNVVKPAVRLYGINSKSEFNAFKAVYGATVNTPVTTGLDDWLVDGAITLNTDLEFSKNTSGDIQSNAFVLKYLVLPLEGNNRTVKCTIAGTAGIIAFIQNIQADVRNLYLDGSYVFTGTGAVRMGALAGYVGGDITVSNVHVKKTATLEFNTSKTTGIANTHFGGLIGQIYGTQTTGNFVLNFVNCSVAGTLSTQQVLTTLGGFIGQGGSGSTSCVNFTDCEFSGTINFKQTGHYNVSNSHAGGRIGGIIGDLSRKATFTRVVNSGTMNADFGNKVFNYKQAAGFGGIAGRNTAVASGYTMGTEMTDVENKAAITIVNVQKNANEFGYNSETGEYIYNGSIGQIIGTRLLAPSVYENVKESGSISVSLAE